MLLTGTTAGFLALTTMTLSMGVMSAQDYPTRPIRIIASEPGGGNDFLARIIAPALAKGLDQNVVIENRPSRLVGPAGAIANPDGYTLIIAGGSFLNAPLIEKTPYDPIKDFTGISQLERSPSVLVVHPSLAANSVKDLIALAKAQPGKLNYSSGGSGTSSHLGAEMFRMITGANIVRVSYRSTGPALIGVVANETQLMFGTAGGAVAHVKSGKLRALAVTSREPTALVPGVPTMIASGVPGFELETIGSLLAPAKTPAYVIKRLNPVVVRAMDQPEVKEKLMAGGSEAKSSTPEQVTAKLIADMARMRKLYATIGVSTEK